jgi:hypothetical protein
MRNARFCFLMQGNPDRFDIDAYLIRGLSKRRRIYWLVRPLRYQNRIRKYHDVFFWRSAGRLRGPAGLIGQGQVVGDPVERETEVPKLWHRPIVVGPALMVPVKVTELRLSPEEGMVTRDEILAHQAAARLPVSPLRTTLHSVGWPTEKALLDLWRAKQPAPRAS